MDGDQDAEIHASLGGGSSPGTVKLIFDPIKPQFKEVYVPIEPSSHHLTL